MNGTDEPSQSIHVLHVGKMRMKICKGKTTVAKEYYSSAMQVRVTKLSANLWEVAMIKM